MRKVKPSIKTALASMLIITSTAIMAYAAPKILESKNIERENRLKLYVEKVDGDTVKVALDNIQDIPKSLQFSIKLEGAILKEGTSSIKDLIEKESETRVKSNAYSTNSNAVLVDYTYNESNNTIDVLITSENAIPKVSNKIEILELDVKPALNSLAKNELPTYRIVPSDNYEYKYVSNTNREYISKTVDYDNESISLNMSPIIKAKDKYIELAKGEKLELTAENLGITMEDPEGKEVKLEVKKDDVVIEEFVSDKAGIYELSCTAIDNYGDRSETIKVQIYIAKDEADKGLVINATDRVIKIGEEFNVLEGVTVTDEDGNIIADANVSVKIENLDSAIEVSEIDTNKSGKYKVTYSVDRNGETYSKEINVIVEDVKEEATLIINAIDKVIKVGDTFNVLDGVTVTDSKGNLITDANIEVKVEGQGELAGESTVNTSKPGEYKITYSVINENGTKFEKQITVTVKENITLAESITINNKYNKLYVGASKILSATINNEADIKDIEWITSNENIVSIDVVGNDAKIVAKAEGQVIITAKTKDGSNKEDSVTIDIVNFNNENSLPSFIKEVIDSNVVKPVAGIGEDISPLELEVQDISIQEFERFLKGLESLQPNLAEVYEEGNFTVYKIKLSRKARLFRNASEGFIELRIDNRLVSANDYKTSIDKLLSNNLPEQPVTPEKPSQGETGNNTNNSETTEDKKPLFEGIKLPLTGKESILVYVGITATIVGGLLFGVKKKKK